MCLEVDANMDKMSKCLRGHTKVIQTLLYS